MTQCHACGSPLDQSTRAVVSPWVREICGIIRRSSVLLVCTACGSNFFSLRFSEEELTRLYKDYRGPQYFAVRNKWEPSYDSRTNSAFGMELSVIEYKRSAVRKALLDGSRVVSELCIVDIGGDRGQFLPPEASRRLLFDISEKELDDGVERITSLDDEIWAQVDAVVMSGVLEHLPDPLIYLQNFVQLVRPGTIFYFEVPAGVPSDGSTKFSRWEFGSALLASRSTYLWRRKDQRLAALRRAGVTSGRRFLRQSEHLNFFTARGMQALLGWSNLDVITLREVSMPTETLDSGRVNFEKNIQINARKAVR